MSETILSPGVVSRENDSSFIRRQPQTFGAAIIGPTPRGPVESPTLVTSFGEFQQKFGSTIESGSNVYSYLTSISANNYFQNGGTSLLVTRVTSGSFSPATSTDILSEDTETVSFELETIGEGEIMNSSGSEALNAALENGTSDNIRWEIPSVDVGSGTFSLIIRRGNDTTSQKTILETYSNISLDPFSPNYISKAIGDTKQVKQTDGGEVYIQDMGTYPNISNYVRVKSVNLKTPNYFDNGGVPKEQFTGSLPLVASGSFEDAIGSNIPTGRAANFYTEINSTDTQGLVAADYSDAIAILSNKDDFQFNVISTPGLINEFHASSLSQLTNMSLFRGDNISIIDLVGFGKGINLVKTESNAFDNSYSTTCWPWVQTVDPNTGELVYVPASTVVPGVYAFTDASSEPWFAPAGLTRGGLGQVVRAERKLTINQRNQLYESNINPIATFPGRGIAIFGQKTLQKRASALDRVNVRRLLIDLKSFIGQIGDTLVFDQNTIATRNSFLTQVNPYLESVQQRQGLFAFRVVMDETNNTPDVIDRNTLVGQIFIQPTRTAEFIVLDFNVTPTGASFE